MGSIVSSGKRCFEGGYNEVFELGGSTARHWEGIRTLSWRRRKVCLSETYESCWGICLYVMREWRAWTRLPPESDSVINKLLTVCRTIGTRASLQFPWFMSSWTIKAHLLIVMHTLTSCCSRSASAQSGYSKSNRMETIQYLLLQECCIVVSIQFAFKYPLCADALLSTGACSNFSGLGGARIEANYWEVEGSG